MSCATCDAPDNLRPCAYCNVTQYCSDMCQQHDLQTHKQQCRGSALGTLERESIANALQINYLNPRPDRTLELHGTTSPVLSPSRHVNHFLRFTNLPKPETMRPLEGYTGEYGKCMQDCQRLVEAKGGDAMFGWSLFHGEYLVEAEFHVVWRPPKKIDSKRRIRNVTPGYGRSAPYTGLFAADPRTKKYIEEHARPPPNMVMWLPGR